MKKSPDPSVIERFEALSVRRGMTTFTPEQDSLILRFFDVTSPDSRRQEDFCKTFAHVYGFGSHSVLLRRLRELKAAKAKK